MNIINYFAERQSVKKVLKGAEIDVIKKCYYCTSCKKCDKFYSIKSELEKRTFLHLTNKLNTGVLEILNLTNPIESLKLGLSEILDLGCKTP